jgi:hypothetical protein
MIECPHGLFDVCCTNYERCTLGAPKKEWVGLTDEEMFDCLVQADGEAKRLPFGFKWFAEAIEAKLKEKNS